VISVIPAEKSGKVIKSQLLPDWEKTSEESLD